MQKLQSRGRFIVNEIHVKIKAHGGVGHIDGTGGTDHIKLLHNQRKERHFDTKYDYDSSTECFYIISHVIPHSYNMPC